MSHASLQRPSETTPGPSNPTPATPAALTVHSDWVKHTITTSPGVASTYFVNRKTKASAWTLPPPDLLPRALAAPLQKHGKVTDFFQKAPSGTPSDIVTPLTFEPPLPEVVVVEKRTAKQLTFIPERVKYLKDTVTDGLGLYSMCEKAGINTKLPNGKHMLKNAIYLEVYDHFKQMHQLEGTEPTSSDCYQGKTQTIDRPRSEGTSAKRKAAANADGAAIDQPAKKASQMKYLTDVEAKKEVTAAMPFFPPFFFFPSFLLLCIYLRSVWVFLTYTATRTANCVN